MFGPCRNNIISAWNKIVLAWNNFRQWFHVEMKIFQSLKLFHQPLWNYLWAIERVGNYANVTCWVYMARHVTVNLLRPFPFSMEPPADIKLYHCKTISHWNILFQNGTTGFHLSSVISLLCVFCSECSLDLDYLTTHCGICRSTFHLVIILVAALCSD